MRRGIVALLSRQQAFGGWFDLNPYEQFRTPFRETQWALMALSSLYPNPKPRSERLERPARAAARGASHRIRRGRSIRDLERIWDAPGCRSRAADRSHSSAMNRRWCATPPAGRWDVSATTRRSRGLARCLGDESKVVRRAAAEALRLDRQPVNGSHRPGETPAQVQLVAELSQALRSPDDRTRRGATRVFAAHFRELSQETALADALLERLDDPDPVVAHAGDQGVVAVVVLASRPRA